MLRRTAVGPRASRIGTDEPDESRVGRVQPVRFDALRQTVVSPFRTVFSIDRYVEPCAAANSSPCRFLLGRRLSWVRHRRSSGRCLRRPARGGAEGGSNRVRAGRVRDLRVDRAVGRVRKSRRCRRPVRRSRLRNRRRRREPRAERRVQFYLLPRTRSGLTHNGRLGVTTGPSGPTPTAASTPNTSASNSSVTTSPGGPQS